MSWSPPFFNRRETESFARECEPRPRVGGSAEVRYNPDERDRGDETHELTGLSWHAELQAADFSTPSAGPIMRVVLASQSPRRLELLRQIGIEPVVLVPEADETRRPGEEFAEFLRRVSISKILAVYEKKYYQSLLVGADTVVIVGEEMIGKPRDRQDAAAMLRSLSGRQHEVWTGVALMHRGETRFETAITQVFFKPLSDREIEHYLDRADYLDKAGAYAIQGRAALFVERIEGCFFNVMGFPLNLFYRMADRFGIDLTAPEPD